MGAEWWLPVNGSYWREPEGPGSDVFGGSSASSGNPGPSSSAAQGEKGGDRYGREAFKHTHKTEIVM